MQLEVKAAGPLPREALEYFRRKKLAPDLDLDAAWPEEHDFAFKVAGVAAEDLLADLQKAVDRALEQGLTYRDFAAGLDDVLGALGWIGEDGKPARRLKLIYDTHMRVARAAGQWDRIVRTAEDGRAYLEYQLGPAAKHREEHVGWAGTILRYNNVWWSTHFPPNGFGCHCRVRQLSDAEAERRGISGSTPGGEPDPGWDRNPGATRGA